MAQLPRVRSEMTQKPFANCADFAGPFYTILGRGRTRVMRYLGPVCVFTDTLLSVGNA